MKSVLPNVTERILRPRIVCRNPRATVSTSGSSGIGRENLQNSTAVGPMLYSEPGISGSFFGAFEKRTGKQISRVRDCWGARRGGRPYAKIAAQLLLLVIRILRSLPDPHVTL